MSFDINVLTYSAEDNSVTDDCCCSVVCHGGRT